MKIIITGMHGTVAPVVANYFASIGHQIVPLDRELVDTNQYKCIKAFIQSVKPDWFFHLGMGSIEFSKDLVTICKSENISFLYTSTVMVFDGNEHGPYDIHNIPTPKSDYGKYKYESEQAILSIDPKAYIIRLGWQIGQGTTGNQMIAHLKKEYLEKGFNEASKDVYLACSFMIESVKAIHQVIMQKPGIYHVDQSQGLSFYDVISYLKSIHPWITPKVAHSTPMNNQMIDNRILIPPLKRNEVKQ